MKILKERLEILELKTLINTLKQTDLPVAYGSFGGSDDDTDIPQPPYLVVLEDARSDFIADNVNYSKSHNYHIEFYFDEKNPELEEKVEAVLTNNSIAFSVSEDMWIPEERFFEKIYSL